jgi:hypothetical protein
MSDISVWSYPLFISGGGWDIKLRFKFIATIIIIIIVITAIELPPGGSSRYTSTDKANKNKYT